MLIFDAHLDLAMNAIDWNRDLRLEVAELRRREVGLAKKGAQRATISLPEMRHAQVGLCLATVLDRTSRPETDVPGFPGSASQEISYAKAQGQLAYYGALERGGAMRQIADAAALDAHLAAWERDPEGTPLGYILAMEGGDPIVEPDQVRLWYEQGLRAVGPAHYGVSRYAHGTSRPGGLSDDGRALLREMDALGMVLDLSHLADDAFWQALELYLGPIMASHNNCRALVPGDRQYSDDQIRAIAQRGGTIGVALDAWMLLPGWVRGGLEQSLRQRERVTMQAVSDHIDHICQLTGSHEHAAIGSDLDGGYGTEQCPRDLDTISDLQRIPELLDARGYAAESIAAVMHGNWLRLFRTALSAG